MDIIPRLTPGDTRTLLSAEEANKLIDVCNKVLNMRGVGGTKVIIGDKEIVISTSAVSGSGGGGTTNITQVTQSFGDTFNCLARYS